MGAHGSAISARIRGDRSWNSCCYRGVNRWAQGRTAAFGVSCPYWSQSCASLWKRSSLAGSVEGKRMRAIRIHKTGGPEVLQLEEIELPKPGKGEVRLRQHAVGVNFLDVYHRTGFYPMPLPLTPGSEGAGD